MAQDRNKRKQRAKSANRPAPTGPSPFAQEQAKRRRRIVWAMLLVVGLVGALVIASPGDEGGAPVGSTVSWITSAGSTTTSA